MDREYRVSVEQVVPHWAAVARATAPRGQLSRLVPATIGVAWEFIRSAFLRTDGINVAIYYGDPAVVPFEAGARVLERFQDSGNVFCVATPAGQGLSASVKVVID